MTVICQLVPYFEGTYQLGATGPNGEPMTWETWGFHYAELFGFWA